MCQICIINSAYAIKLITLLHFIFMQRLLQTSKTTQNVSFQKDGALYYTMSWIQVNNIE